MYCLDILRVKTSIHTYYYLHDLSQHDARVHTEPIPTEIQGLEEGRWEEGNKGGGLGGS